MNARSSSFLSMLITLVMVTLVASVSLGFVYEWTKEPIEQARVEKQKKAIDKVAGEYDNDPIGESFEMSRERGKRHHYRRRMRRHGKEPAADKTEEVVTLYPAKKQEQPTITAIKAASNNGYSGKIELMVGIDTAGVIRSVEVLEHKETPGLGSKIRDQSFIEQYLGKSPETFDLKVKKDGGEVDAISGATISSRAFSEAVQSAYDAFKSQSDEKRTDQ